MAGLIELSVPMKLWTEKDDLKCKEVLEADKMKPPSSR
jgi:hypothetical protein